MFANIWAGELLQTQQAAECAGPLAFTEKACPTQFASGLRQTHCHLYSHNAVSLIFSTLLTKILYFTMYYKNILQLFLLNLDFSVRFGYLLGIKKIQKGQFKGVVL